MGRLHEALRKAEGTRGRGSAPRAQTAAHVADPVRAEARHAAGESREAALAASVESLPAAVGAQTPVYVPTALRDDVDPRLVPVADPESATAEQFRALRTNLLGLAQANSWKVFAVTSATPREGSSTSAANLACVLAEQTERRIVLLDADLRTPVQHSLFAIDNQRGLSDYLSGGSMLEMSLQRSRLSNLWVLPAGRAPANPAELLSGKRMEDLLARLRRDYDYVVIDTPSLDAAPDAAVLAPRADATLLVVRMEATQRGSVHAAIEVLRNAKAHVAGTILTALPDEAAAA